MNFRVIMKYPVYLFDTCIFVMVICFPLVIISVYFLHYGNDTYMFIIESLE